MIILRSVAAHRYSVSHSLAGPVFFLFCFLSVYLYRWLFRVRSLNDLYAEAKVGETTNKQTNKKKQLNDSETTSRLRPAAEEFFRLSDSVGNLHSNLSSIYLFCLFVCLFLLFFSSAVVHRTRASRLSLDYMTGL